MATARIWVKLGGAAEAAPSAVLPWRRPPQSPPLRRGGRARDRVGSRAGACVANRSVGNKFVGELRWRHDRRSDAGARVTTPRALGPRTRSEGDLPVPGSGRGVLVTGPPSGWQGECRPPGLGGAAPVHGRAVRRRGASRRPNGDVRRAGRGRQWRRRVLAPDGEVVREAPRQRGQSHRVRESGRRQGRPASRNGGELARRRPAPSSRRSQKATSPWWSRLTSSRSSSTGFSGGTGPRANGSAAGHG